MVFMLYLFLATTLGRRFTAPFTLAVFDIFAACFTGLTST